MRNTRKIGKGKEFLVSVKSSASHGNKCFYSTNNLNKKYWPRFQWIHWEIDTISQFLMWFRLYEFPGHVNIYVPPTRLRESKFISLFSLAYGNHLYFIHHISKGLVQVSDCRMVGSYTTYWLMQRRAFLKRLTQILKAEKYWMSRGSDNFRDCAQ